MNNKYNYIKFKYLEEICGDDNGIKKELIHIFLKQIPSFISNMNKYLNENDDEELAREAHTAKSSALVFMMDETAEILKQIQLLAQDNNKKNIPSLINKVEAHLLEASDELTTYLEERNN